MSFLDPVLEEIAKGVTPVSELRGPRRMPKRLAKKVLGQKDRPWTWREECAFKTLLRAKNRAALAAWSELSEEEKGKQKMERLVWMASPVASMMMVHAKTREKR